MDLPRIRQTLFILDKFRNYKFDVNQNITIKNLKRMIIAAANLGKSGLRVFHKGVEYTEREDERLDDLFPELQLVEFTVTIVHVEETDKDRLLKVRLGEYCPVHQFKYPYFYCYDCRRSICSACLKDTNDHLNHNYIEKYDYLQSSRNLVEEIFHDMNDLLSGSKFNYKSETENLKNRFKIEFFPTLVQLVMQIEAKFNEVIERYNETAEISFDNMQNNVGLIKSHCSEGLDKLKNEIAIEDLMLDESVFLTFDRKFKEIAGEKSRISENTRKFEDQAVNFNIIASTLQKYYNEIYDFLTGYLNSNFFTEIVMKLTEDMIRPVEKEAIITRLMSDVKPRNGRRDTTSFKLTHDTPSKNDNRNTSQFIIGENNNNNIGNSLRTPKTSRQGFNANPNLQTAPGISDNTGNVIITKTTTEEIRTVTNQNPIQTSRSASRSQSLSPLRGQGATHNPTDNIVMTLIPHFRDIKIYNDNKTMISRQHVDFATNLLGISTFPDNTAYINHKGQLYITGGVVNGSPINHFLVYNVFSNTLTRLADMHNARDNHSMYLQDDSIYVVGGSYTNTCERFDIKTQKWTKLANLFDGNLQRSVLFIKNNFLFSFFGMKLIDQSGNNINTNIEYIDTIQRLNLRNNKAKWEIVPPKNPHNINLKMIGCGIIETGTEDIYMFGGKTQQTIKNDAISFSFVDFSFEPLDIKLEDGTYFMESKLINFGEDAYGHFNLAKDDILKLQIS